ncbi:putative sensory transduction histidine kinase [Candidatus Sulfopaludibacter sp. SbA4]|nr:putative sensory transduction histidine kinase [Candidatus Sulfopaludibacter sp. SbA4]
MRVNRSVPILLVGFGMLIGLMALTGVSALQRARETYLDVSRLNDRYRRTDRVLNGIAFGIYKVGLLTRDYLLDPSNVPAAEYRADLVEERSAMEKEVAELSGVVLDSNRPELKRLRMEVNAYWDALDPLFQWTEEEKAARSWAFLRQEVLPHRQAALGMAQEFSRLTQANLDDQRREIDRKQAQMAVFIGRMVGVTVLIGLGIAAIAVLRMTKLERHSEQQRLRTVEAERELRRLSRQLVHAQEEERKSISRELHDEVGQMLTGLRMELRSLQDLRIAPEEEFIIHLDGAKRLAEQSLRSLRDIAMGLRPSLLDDLGLGPAVQWQARQFSKHTGIPVNVNVDRLHEPLPEEHRTCIYRIVQEALTNCARHAKAKTIDIVIDGPGVGISVVVKDDGIGFDPGQVRGRGLGLTGMQERVMDLGGELTVVSQVSKGTVLSAKIPIPTEVPPIEYSSSVGR